MLDASTYSGWNIGGYAHATVYQPGPVTPSTADQATLGIKHAWTYEQSATSALAAAK